MSRDDASRPPSGGAAGNAMQKMTSVSREVLNAVVRHIVERFHPIRVISFGSQAQEDSTRIPVQVHVFIACAQLGLS